MATDYINIVVMQRGAQQVRRDLEAIGSGADVANRSLALMQRTLGLIGAGVGISGLVRMADAYTNLSNRLRLVAQDTSNLAYLQEQVFRVAQRSRAPLEAVAQLYSRTALNAAALGLTQSEILGLTESVSQAFAISGATAAEASGSIIQFTQGLAQGTLRGQELNSVLEQAPRLAQAIAAGMGVGVYDLKRLGEQGKITSKAIADALAQEAPKIREEFEKLTPTIDSAMTVLNNSLVDAVGRFDQATGASTSFAQSIIWAAGNLESFTAVASVLGTLLLATLVPALISSTVAVTRLTAAMLLNPATWMAATIAVLAGALTMMAIEANAAKTALDQTEVALSNNADAIERAKTSSSQFRANLRAQIEMQLAAAEAALVEAEAQKQAFSWREAGAKLTGIVRLFGDHFGPNGGQNGQAIVNETLGYIDTIKDETNQNVTQMAANIAALRAQLGVLDEMGPGVSEAPGFPVTPEKKTKTEREKLTLQAVLNEYQREIDLLRMSNEERVVQEQLLTDIDRLRKDGVNLSPIETQQLEQQIQLLEDIRNQSEQLGQVLERVFKGAEDAFVQFIETGKVDFSGLITSMISDLARLAFQQFITKPVTNALNGVLGGFNLGGLFGGGAATGGMGYYPGLTGPALPGFATGTSFTVGGNNAVDGNLVQFRASRGERVTVGRNDLESDGGQGRTTVIMNISTPNAESFRASETQIAARMSRAANRGSRNL